MNQAVLCISMSLTFAAVLLSIWTGRIHRKTVRLINDAIARNDKLIAELDALDEQHSEAPKWPQPQWSQDMIDDATVVDCEALLYRNQRRACPMCSGDGFIIAAGIIYAEGHSGPPVDRLPCPRCSGKCSISWDEFRWGLKGDQLRSERENMGLGLRQAADLWGMKPSELSDIESGKVDNLEWSPSVSPV